MAVLCRAFCDAYFNHKVKQQSLIEYSECLAEMGITKAEARYGSTQ
jgi:hypothetical protein